MVSLIKHYKRIDFLNFSFVSKDDVRPCKRTTIVINCFPPNDRTQSNFSSERAVNNILKTISTTIPTKKQYWSLCAQVNSNEYPFEEMKMNKYDECRN